MSLEINFDLLEAAPAKTPPVNAPVEPKPGDKMPDGTVFAGTSPDTGEPLYTTPADTTLAMAFNKAQEYAAQLDKCGHKDWRLPTKAELNVMFNNRAAIGGFSESISPNPSNWYWAASSSTEQCEWGQNFSDGAQDYNYKLNYLSVRLVR